MPRTKKNEQWYFKYLRNYCRQIFGWSPERKKALRRAQISKDPELYRCEECGRGPLLRSEKEVDHIEPCENIAGWDGWDNYIQRTIEVPSELICIVCKECHYKKSAAENKARRAKGRDPSKV